MSAPECLIDYIRGGFSKGSSVKCRRGPAAVCANETGNCATGETWEGAGIRMMREPEDLL